tara:strand:+ start:97 stop:237 length:141 start_codon:yes stop_codon:yes gene_type:complete
MDKGVIGIVTNTVVLKEMNDEWNKIFLDNWKDIYDSRNIDGIKYKP